MSAGAEAALNDFFAATAARRRWRDMVGPVLNNILASGVRFLSHRALVGDPTKPTLRYYPKVMLRTHRAGSSGTFIPKAGVGSIFIHAVGAGGTANAGGFVPGGGAFFYGTYAVTPGASYAWAQATGNTSSGANGADTTFDVLTAGGGGSATAGNGLAGVCNAAVTGNVNLTSSSGTTGNTNSASNGWGDQYAQERGPGGYGGGDEAAGFYGQPGLLLIAWVEANPTSLSGIGS